MNRIRAGQMSFLGHIMRKHGLENIVVTGKIEGERSRGRPRMNFTKSLSQLLKIRKPGRVENHDRQRPNWIRHLERERVLPLNISTGVFVQVAGDKNDKNEDTLLGGMRTTQATTLSLFQRGLFGPASKLQV